MKHFLQRIGANGCERILIVTIKAGLESNTIKRADLARVTVDATVQEKAVSFPTDSKLLNRSRVHLVKLGAGLRAWGVLRPAQLGVRRPAGV